MYDYEKDKEIEELKNYNNELESKLMYLSDQINKFQEIYKSKLKRIEGERDFCINLQNETTNADVPVCDCRKINTPEFILNESLFSPLESRKNKSTNDLKSSSVIGLSRFEQRKNKNNNHWQIPCKLMLYKNGKGLDKRYFDSVSACAKFTGLRPYEIMRSMLYAEYNTYFTWNGRYYEGHSNLPSRDNDKVYIRVCAITPMVIKD